MYYRSKDGQDYVLNLIDTPGHVDFSYEVSRSLAACEGAILVVDASQGVEAQTISNLYLAIDGVPRDHPGDQQNRSPYGGCGSGDRADRLPSWGWIPFSHLKCSAEEGIGIEEILEAIVKKNPARPKGDRGSTAGRAGLSMPSMIPSGEP